MESHIVTTSAPLPASVLQQIARDGPLDEISNAPGAVRLHISRHPHRDRATGVLETPMLFLIFQTGRYGPQNGFRLCTVRRGFRIGSATKAAGAAVEDGIDELEREIPQGHVEVAFLG